MKINLKHIIAGLALLFSTVMANATTINMGDLTTYGDTGYVADVTLGKGLFSDVYDFSIPSVSEVGGAVTSLYFKLGAKTWDISNLSLTLMSGSTVLGTGTSIDVMGLTQGNYSFTVAGNASGTQGGKYFFDAIAAPVPEPSTWALMLGGLGLIGFMSYRRRQYL